MFGISDNVAIEAFKQGALFLLALIMFVVWVHTKKDHERGFKEREKTDEERERKLVGILHDRKNDRDQLLLLMGEIKAHLARADQFEQFARDVMEGVHKPSPKRRLMDRQLAEALGKINTDDNKD
jgi:hypothetical protein